MPKAKRTAQAKPTTGRQERSLQTVEFRALEGQGRTLQVSFSSEEPYERWFGSEILQHDADSIDLSRLNEIGVLLFNHCRDDVLGKVIKAWVDPAARRCYADVQFDTDEDSEKIYQKVLSGTLKGTSVCYDVDNWEEVADGKSSTSGRFTGPCWVALRWVPFEISIVSIPADPTVGVGRSADEPGAEPITIAIPADGSEANINQEGRKMDEKLNIPAVDAAAILSQERSRVEAISNLCKEHGVDAAPMIKDGLTVEQAGLRTLELLKAKPAPTQFVVKTDERDKFRAAAEDAISMRAGLKVEKPADGAKELRSMSLMELCREMQEREGGIRIRDRETLLRQAFGQGTGDFTNLLANVASKSLNVGYALAPVSYPLWTKRGVLSDYKAAKRVQFSEFPLLDKVPEGGEAKVAQMGDMGESITLGKYEKIFAITREALINDDLSAFTDIPQKMGAAARLTVEAAVMSILTTNAALADGVALFYATTHVNLAGTSAALTVASLGAAKAAMAKQKGLLGVQPLNIQMAYLLVPSEIEVVARQLIASSVDPAKSNSTINPFQNAFTVIPSPILSASSATAWYGASAPGYCDTIETAFLDGNDTPTIEEQEGWTRSGREYKVRLEFAAKALDFRGLYKNAGA